MKTVLAVLKNLLNGMLAPLTFWKSDELLMQDIDNEKFFACNIRNKEIRDLGIDRRIENRLSYIGTPCALSGFDEG